MIRASTIRGSHLAIIFVMLAFYIPVCNLFSQNIPSKASRQSSLEAFSKKDYEKAYSEFSELLNMYPKDPLYKYYSGVCLVKLNRNANEAVSLLRQAQQGSAVVKTIPSDAAFWLGRAQQLSGDFIGARESYDLFTEQAGKKAAKELEVPVFIQQCRENIGKASEKTQSAVTSARNNDTSSEPEKKKKLPVNNVSQNENKIIPGNETLPADYDILLSEALDYQYKADSVYKIAEDQKKTIESLGFREKTELRNRIAETENLAASFQKIADQKYNEAQTKMNATPFTGDKNIKQRDSLYAVSTDTTKQNKQVTITDSVARVDTIKVFPVILKLKNVPDKQTDQVSTDTAEHQVIKRDITPPVKIAGEVYVLFEANAKPSEKDGGKIVIEPEIPEGLIYRIQTAVFRNTVALSYFKGLSPVFGFKVPGTDKTNYYVGIFRQLADAKKALVTVRQKGFKDAFIVPLSGGKPVSAERAALLEKTWGKKSLVAGLNTRTEVLSDTLPPTLSFRVEVTRAAKPLKDEILEGMKKMAGTRGLETEILADGTIIYLIGRFITFESAEEFAGLLTRNGYRNSRVAAWLGKKEIPVETARQLFERLE